MAGREHRYVSNVSWAGNRGSGTSGYGDYGREHVIRIPGKPDLAGSSDPAFRGDPAVHNPEDLLVASVSACHMLWYLALAASAGIVVTGYEDAAEGTMVEDRARGGWFTRIVLRPRISVAAGTDLDRATALHADAHAKCFIANSVNFPIDVAPTFVAAAT
jgi:organic hydroperoxide reductase OsmC/OhrA